MAVATPSPIRVLGSNPDRSRDRAGDARHILMIADMLADGDEGPGTKSRAALPTADQVKRDRGIIHQEEERRIVEKKD
jgi:hypothetical protein